LYNACRTGTRPSSMSLRQFLTTGLQFCHHLTMHHTIEENCFFPLLAERMPAFKDPLVNQHAEIHTGLDQLERYLKECKNGEREMRLPEMKVIMDTFGEILWTHLDEEVRELGAENTRKYWTLEDMRRMPM